MKKIRFTNLTPQEREDMEKEFDSRRHWTDDGLHLIAMAAHQLIYHRVKETMPGAEWKKVDARVNRIWNGKDGTDACAAAMYSLMLSRKLERIMAKKKEEL